MTPTTTQSVARTARPSPSTPVDDQAWTWQRNIFAYRLVPCDVPGVVHVVLRGELDVYAAPALDRLFDQLCVRCRAQLHVDLDGVQFMDAAGLRVFVGLARVLEESGRSLKLCQASRAVHRLLAITEQTHLLA